MICIFSIAKINVQNYNSVVILSNTHIKKKIFILHWEHLVKKKNPTQLFTIKSNKNNHFSN